MIPADRLAGALVRAAPPGAGPRLRALAPRILHELEADGLTVTAAPPRPCAGTFVLIGTAGEQQPVIVDALGSVAVRLSPRNELAFILDLTGQRNRPPSTGDHAGPAERVEARYLLAPGQVAELIIALGQAAHYGGPEAAQALEEALDRLDPPPEATP